MLEQKIIYIKNKSNLDNAGSRNVGIKKAKGEYISFLDDDDEWLKSKIEKQICLIKKSNLHVCFCGTHWKENNTIIEKNITKSNMVSFENGGQVDFIKNGENGFFVNVGDVKATSEQI
jgi:glycosyltransferase involved in cell wall biosynthesis